MSAPQPPRLLFRPLPLCPDMVPSARHHVFVSHHHRNDGGYNRPSSSGSVVATTLSSPAPLAWVRSTPICLTSRFERSFATSIFVCRPLLLSWSEPRPGSASTSIGRSPPAFETRSAIHERVCWARSSKLLGRPTRRLESAYDPASTPRQSCVRIRGPGQLDERPGRMQAPVHEAFERRTWVDPEGRRRTFRDDLEGDYWFEARNVLSVGKPS